MLNNLTMYIMDLSTTKMSPISCDGRPINFERQVKDGDGGQAAGTPLDSVQASSPSGTVYAKTRTSCSSPRSMRTNSEGDNVSVEGPSEEQDYNTPKIPFYLLNANGRWAYTPASGRVSKLLTIRDLMIKDQVDLCFLTETHLSEDESVPNVELIFRSDCDSTRAGIAVLTRNSKWKVKEDTVLLEGYSALLTLVSTREQVLNALLIYGNISKGNTSLQEHLRLTYKQTKGKVIDLMVGDWNVSRKHIPPRENNEFRRRIEASFQKITQGYREVIREGYTFHHRNGAWASCPDRIFATQSIAISGDWTHFPMSDHRLFKGSILRVTAKRGRGPSKMKPPGKSKEWNDFAKTCQAMIQEVSLIEDDMELQDTWIALKAWMRDSTPEKPGNKQHRKLLDALNELRSDVDRKDLEYEWAARRPQRRYQLNAPLRDAEEVAKEALSVRVNLTLDEIIRERRINEIHSYYKHEERPTKSFYKKQPKAKTTMASLLDADGTEVHSTKDKTKVAVDFYKSLHTSEGKGYLREGEIEDLMDKIRDEIPKIPMKSGPFGVGELKTALKKAKNGKAPGPDGIPFEWWKRIVKAPEEGIDPLTSLTKILESFKRGIRNTEFTRADMTLLYKKGDPREMKNYRPISLVNTDYKLMTLMLNERLMEHAQAAIHKDQAGFIRGRVITDHIRLSQLLDGLDDPNLGKGTILSLDNEKAYDRVEHDYLWKVLETFGVPGDFIDSVKSIYKGARSRIWVNGFRGGTFPLKRGVRQGDPLSCLLFDYAIEVLAIQVRKTNRLRGIEIGRGLSTDTNQRKNIIKIKLFADDTQIFLREGERVGTFMQVSSQYRRLSGAKYNTEKSEAYTFNGARKDPNSEIKYNEGQVRVLGAFINDGSRAYEQWKTISKKVKEIAWWWSKQGLSIKGRTLIAKALMLSRTLYLAVSSGIPPEMVEKLDSTVRGFVWGHKKWFPSPWESMRTPKEYGGINCFTVKDRSIAANIKFIADLLDRDKEDWAILAASTLINNTGSSTSKKTAVRGLNPLQQKGYVFLNKTPYILKKALQTCYEWKIGVDEQALSKKAKEMWPLLYHPGNDRSANNRLGDLEKNKTTSILYISRIHERVCKTKPGHRKRIRLLKENLENTWWDPTQERATDLIIDGVKTSLGNRENDWKECVRLMPDRATSSLSRVQDEKRGWIRKAKIPVKKYVAEGLPPETTFIHPKATVFTDGSAKPNGYANAVTGCGVYVEEAELAESYLLTSPVILDNNSAEMAAIGLALTTVRARDVTVKTDSKVAINEIRKSYGSHKRGLIDSKYPHELHPLIEVLRKRGGSLTLEWVKGHSGIKGNEMADMAAGLAHESPGEEVELDHIPPTGLTLKGRTLKEITKWVMLKRVRPMKDSYRLESLQDVTLDKWGKEYNPKRLHRAIWNTGRWTPDTSEFLWKWMYNILADTSIKWREMACPWCREEAPSLDHTLWKCEGLKLYWLIGESMNPRGIEYEGSGVEDPLNWKLLPVLTEWSKERDRKRENDRKLEERMVLILRTTWTSLTETISGGNTLEFRTRWLALLRERMDRQELWWEKKPTSEDKKRKGKRKGPRRVANEYPHGNPMHLCEEGCPRFEGME